MRIMTRKRQKMTHAQEAVSLRTGRAVPDLLREMSAQGLSNGAIADELGVSRNTIAMWLREFQVSRA
jgi:DNA-binding NarL/FixJ family response regulator